MKDLKLFLEHRVVDVIKFKCKKTNQEINPYYCIYDKESLDSYIRKYGLNKEQFENMKYYFATPSKRCWTVQTGIEYKFDVSRRMDKFLSSDNIDYSYDDIVSLIEDGDRILTIIN